MSPDRRQHRGPHPSDEELFDERHLPHIRAGVGDLSWLLTRGYQINSSLQLVGDRYGLRKRQRIALMRAACSEQSLQLRRRTCVNLANVKGAALVIDGFNLLVTIEAAMSGGVILVCRDGCARDLASVHGSYRAVEETEAAIRLVGTTLDDLGVDSARWLFDQPVSNSGRAAASVRRAAETADWRWTAEVVPNPDCILREQDGLIVSSDSNVLDAGTRWVNLARVIVDGITSAWLVDLSIPPARTPTT